MTTITIATHGLDELVRNLGSLEAKVSFKDAANRSIAEVMKFVMVEVPKRTHQLQQSHLLSPASIGSMHAEVYTEKEYAVPVHEGHRIVAWGHDTGRFKPANPWMERAVRKAEPTIDRYFEAAADDLINAIIR